MLAPFFAFHGTGFYCRARSGQICVHCPAAEPSCQAVARMRALIEVRQAVPVGSGIGAYGRVQFSLQSQAIFKGASFKERPRERKPEYVPAAGRAATVAPGADLEEYAQTSNGKQAGIGRKNLRHLDTV